MTHESSSALVLSIRVLDPPHDFDSGYLRALGERSWRSCAACRSPCSCRFDSCQTCRFPSGGKAGACLTFSLPSLTYLAADGPNMARQGLCCFVAVRIHPPFFGEPRTDDRPGVAQTQRIWHFAPADGPPVHALVQAPSLLRSRDRSTYGCIWAPTTLQKPRDDFRSDSQARLDNCSSLAHCIQCGKAAELWKRPAVNKSPWSVVISRL